ncbi:MAG: TetR/AcrR family transcriptional regulator [Treponema sp.]|jgi:AcrR family transcriptional regulator|nr:TetR/AcrR family transcriptional regulator [Treponema sp.]
MGIVERKERERAERRALIMSCAKELILKYGPNEVSMAEIAERAELSKATLYLYFSSKDVLYRDICEEAANTFDTYLQSRMPANGLRALDALNLYWRCFLDIFGVSDDILIFFSMKRYLVPAAPFIPLEEGVSPPGDSSYQFFHRIQRIITQGIEEGFFEADADPAMVARMILSSFSFMVEDTMKLPKERREFCSVIGEMRNMVQIMLRGIAGKGIDKTLINLALPDNHAKKPGAE